MIISCHTSLDCIIKYEADSCFIVSLNLLPQTGYLKLINWVKIIFCTLLATFSVYYIVISITAELENQLENRITVYEIITATVTALSKVINHYLSLWKDNKTVVDISEDEWMKISLLNNWKELYKSDQIKVYLLDTKNCKIIDEAFDKLHQQGCMIWTTQFIPFTYSCFVIWKTTLTDQKSYVVVDIWVLNWITMPDIYLVSN